MARLGCLVVLALFAGVAATEVTPIQKVIELIQGMHSDLEGESRNEASAYDDFACFCKTQTDAKSNSVKRETDRISRESADIADKTQERKDDGTELVERKQKEQNLNKDLDDTTARCAQQKAEYEAEEADLSKAIQGLEDAIKAMGDSKPSGDSTQVFLAVKQTLSKTLAMADAMNMIKNAKHGKAVAAFLQQSASVDPNDPEYDFHSDDIIKVCDDLLVEYKKSRSDLDTEWGKTEKGCNEMKASLNKKLEANTLAMNQLDKDIERLGKEIAQHRENLITADGILKDDKLYLKDMTTRCEDRANDYDQRSALRADELAALTSALKVLQGTVEDADKANKRAFIQAPSVAAEPVAKASTGAVLKSISFLQELASSSGQDKADLTLEARKGKALNVLRQEGQRIHSLTLTSLAERASADPFKKIKGLIQKLIERLLTESKNEATKKGFCDTELAKSRKERDFRWTDANDLSAVIASLQAKKDSLKEEITELTKDIKDETKALNDATDERKIEKDNNLDTLRTAKTGLDGVNEALLTLKVFYKQAAKAAFVQASPVDQDTKGPGFSGNYKGNQSGAKAVLALLETIASDFDRTLRKTEEAEAAAHREYVEFKQTSDASIAGKNTKKTLDEEDLETTLTSIKTKTDDMQTAVDLLDAALKELEELKDTCIDTGMSYSQRVEKREEEMAALQKALCILDEEGVESSCGGGNDSYERRL